MSGENKFFNISLTIGSKKYDHKIEVKKVFNKLSTIESSKYKYLQVEVLTWRQLCEKVLGQNVSRGSDVNGVVRAGFRVAFPAVADDQPHPARSEKARMTPSNIFDRKFDQFGNVFDADHAAAFADHDGHAGGQVARAGPDVESSHSWNQLIRLLENISSEYCSKKSFG